MEREVTIPTYTLKVKNEKGSVLLEAPVMEVYYVSSEATMHYYNWCDETNTARSQKSAWEAAAKAINAEFNSDLNWAEVAGIMTEVAETVEEVKKNSESTSE